MKRFKIELAPGVYVGDVEYSRRISSDYTLTVVAATEDEANAVAHTLVGKQWGGMSIHAAVGSYSGQVGDIEMHSAEWEFKSDARHKLKALQRLLGSIELSAWISIYEDAEVLEYAKVKEGDKVRFVELSGASTVNDMLARIQRVM